MHSKSNNTEITNNDEVDKAIEELFKSLKNRYQNNFESMKVKMFVLDYVHLLYYKCHKINPNHGGSYIDSPDLIKNKKAKINPINKKDDKCFQHDVTVESYHKKIKNEIIHIVKNQFFF